MDGYMAEVRIFAGTYAPVNWAFCWGQLLSIASYSSLYALIGTQYGGDGVSTFGLPDLRGRVPIGAGSGPGLTPRTQGQFGGYERITLTQANLPSHQHKIEASTVIGSTGTPSSSTILAAQDRHHETNIYTTSASNTEIKPTGSIGSGQQVENMQPWLGLNYIICLVGLWPSRS